MVRILHIGLSANIGGIESFLINLYRSIDRKQVQFDFIAYDNCKALENEILHMGGKVFNVSCKKFYYFSKTLRNIMLVNNYDIVHIHKNSWANIVPLLVCKSVGITNIVWHSHNTKPSIKNVFYISLLHYINKKLFSSLVDYKLACSKVAAEWMFGKNLSDVVLINNGIEVKKFEFNISIRNSMRSSMGISEDTFVLGSVGRISEQKNQKFLLDLVKELKSLRKCKLILCGDGELRKNLENYAYRIGISNDVIFTGARNDVNILLNVMDVFLLPSLWEGLPVVCVEAQANGLPCIVSSAVSDEANITKSFHKIENYDLDCWIKTIFSNENRNKNAVKEIVQSGYDIRHSLRKLMEIYIYNKYSDSTKKEG